MSHTSSCVAFKTVSQLRSSQLSFEISSAMSLVNAFESFLIHQKTSNEKNRLNDLRRVLLITSIQVLSSTEISYYLEISLFFIRMLQSSSKVYCFSSVSLNATMFVNYGHYQFRSFFTEKLLDQVNCSDA